VALVGGLDHSASCGKIKMGQVFSLWVCSFHWVLAMRPHRERIDEGNGDNCYVASEIRTGDGQKKRKLQQN